MRGAALIVAALLAVALTGPAAQAAEPSASLTDIEDEVMCPICGTLLELSEAPQAERQRVFIRRQIAAGRTKEEIVDALVAEYGSEVLALPEGEGFELSAYVVPVLAFLLGASALAFGVMRWRRQAGEAGEAAATGGTTPAEDDRIDAEISRYDL